MQWNVALYDHQHDFVSTYGKSLIELLRPGAGEKILDLGCGTGDLTHELLLKECEVTGIDGSSEMINEAKRKYPNISFLCADARSFDLREQFDAVFSNAVLHWVKVPDAVLDRVFFHLKPGGRFVAEFGAKGNVGKIISAVKDVLAEHHYKKQAAINNWYFPSVAEYATKLEQHGFDIRFIESYDRPTVLRSTENGVIEWLEMFAAAFFEGMDTHEKQKLLYEIQDRLYDELYQDGNLPGGQAGWIADYKRLRFYCVVSEEATPEY